VDLNVPPFTYIQTFYQTKNQGVLTMKKISLVLVILIACCLIPAVSAETIIDSDFVYHNDTSVSGTTPPATGSGYYGAEFKNIRLTNIEKRSGLSYIILDVPYENDNTFSATLPDGEHDLTYTIDSDNPKPCKVYVQTHKNLLQMVTSIRFTIFFDEWDIGDKIGTKTIVLSNWLWKGAHKGGSPTSPVVVYSTHTSSEKYVSGGFYYVVASWVEWKNHLNVIKEEGDYYDITLIRNFNNMSYLSTIDLIKNAVTVASDSENNNYHSIFALSEIDSIKISAVGQEYNVPLGSSGEGDSTPVTVYIRNSQNHALIANAHINISANVNGNFHEVVNETVPSGIYSSELQPTGGGMPNPDFYRLIVTAEGYNSILSYFDFELDRVTKIYAYLDPTGGAPEDENNTFIDFYVRDMSANPISGATVNFGGYTLITNSAGYTIFEVAKNKTYSWTVSKSGYGSLTGNAVIGSNGRHTINTVLAPAVTPTIPTAIPTSTPISPTPTLTAPTGEPVSNWLEWFAAHFGMILGGGVEIGKIFMWLCFAVPVGVYVGKEAKAGAAGFMAGAGIVTLFFVLIGWVPIWLLVLLALIIGLLYAKIFNNSDTGGGR
jgi:uncharacterized protein (DUF2147 family)